MTVLSVTIDDPTHPNMVSVRCRSGAFNAVFSVDIMQPEWHAMMEGCLQDLDACAERFATLKAYEAKKPEFVEVDNTTGKVLRSWPLDIYPKP